MYFDYRLFIGFLIPAAILVGIRSMPEPYHEARTITDHVETFTELSRKFTSLAEKKGALYAFEILRRVDVPPQTDFHLLGHAIGDVLYEQEGVRGMQHCTQEFRNACSHSIVIGVLLEFGEAMLPEIHNACSQAPGGDGAYYMCYHGLGHGIFAFYKYSFPETVALCEKISDNPEHREAIECIGGAVMELAGGGGHDHEQWEAAREKYLGHHEPLAFCQSSAIPAFARSHCVMYITPELWSRVGIQPGTHDLRSFAAAFEACRQLPHSKTDLRRACFSGFGKEFMPIAAGRDIRHLDVVTDDVIRQAIAWCRTAEERDGISWCLNEGMNSLFWGGENNPDVSFQFCALIDDTEMQHSCYRRLADRIGRFTDEDRSALCARLPEVDRTDCL